MNRSNTLVQIARLVMFITSLFNLYFLCGITKRTLLHNKAFTRKLRAAFFTIMPWKYEGQKKGYKTATSQIYEVMYTPFKNIFGVKFAKAQTTIPELGI